MKNPVKCLLKACQRLVEGLVMALELFSVFILALLLHLLAQQTHKMEKASFRQPPAQVYIYIYMSRSTPSLHAGSEDIHIQIHRHIYLKRFLALPVTTFCNFNGFSRQGGIFLGFIFCRQAWCFVTTRPHCVDRRGVS